MECLIQDEGTLALAKLLQTNTTIISLECVTVLQMHHMHLCVCVCVC